MANIKISDLTSAASVSGTQEFEVNDSGTSKKVTGAQIADYVEGAINQLSLDNTGLQVKDTDASHTLTIKPGSNLTDNKTLTVTTGDADRTLDISAGSVTITTAGAALLDDADAAAQRTTLGLGTGNSPEFTAVNVGNSSDTTVSRAAAGVIAVEGNQVPSPAFQAHGDILYRDASSWQRLAAGTSGQVLTSQGSGSAPVWGDASGTPTGSVIPFAGLTEPSGWLFCYGQSISRTTYASLFAALSKNATVTITIATPGVVSWTSHGLVAGDPVTFNTTGALPTGITAGTTYYVISAGLTADAFQISATLNGAAVNTSGTQSGTHTAYHVPYGVASTTNFNLPDLRGRVVAGDDSMGGTSANRLTGQSGGVDGDILGGTGGAETHTLTTAQLASHAHNVGYATADNAGSTPMLISSTLSSNVGTPSNVSTSSTGSGSAHNNIQPTIILNYIIKT